MEDDRFVLTQQHIDALNNRRALDAEFAAFMKASIADREDIRAKVSNLETAVADNTRTTNEVHTALFAKNDNNEFGITGLVTNMQSVVKHIEVVCSIAKFLKWSVVGTGSLAAAAVPFGKIFGWW